MTFRARDDYFTVHEEHSFRPWRRTGSQNCWRAADAIASFAYSVALEFSHAAQLLALCRRNGPSVAALMMKMSCFATATDVAELFGKYGRWQAASSRPAATEGYYPKPYQVPRRACALHKTLQANCPPAIFNRAELGQCLAIAASEENASGDRLLPRQPQWCVRIIPAAPAESDKFVTPPDRCLTRFFLTAAAIGRYCLKQNALFWDLEVGCQGKSAWRALNGGAAAG